MDSENIIDFDKQLILISNNIKCKWCGEISPAIRRCYKSYIHINNPEYESQHYAHVCMDVECHKKGKIAGYFFTD